MGGAGGTGTQKSCLMRLPANLTMAHRISELQTPYQFLNTSLSLAHRAKDTQPAAEHVVDT